MSPASDLGGGTTSKGLKVAAGVAWRKTWRFSAEEITSFLDIPASRGWRILSGESYARVTGSESLGFLGSAITNGPGFEWPPTQSVPLNPDTFAQYRSHTVETTGSRIESLRSWHHAMASATIFHGTDDGQFCRSLHTAGRDTE